MVSKELERNNGQQRSETLFGLRDSDDEIGHFTHLLVAFCDDRDDATLTGFDLLNVRNYLLVRAAMRCHNYYRHLIGDKGDGAMFHLGSGITFSVNV